MNFSVSSSLTMLSNDTTRYAISIAASYAIFSALAILLHILVAIAVFRVFKIKNFNAFHILVLNLYFADILMFVVYLLYVSPSIVLSDQIFDHVGAKLIGCLQTADFIASIFLTLCISVNRALSMNRNKMNDIVFTKKNCCFFGVAAWIIGAVTLCWNYYVDCWTILDVKAFNFRTTCGSAAVNVATSPSSMAVYVGVYCVGAFYVYAAYNVKKQYRQVQSDQLQQVGKAQTLRLLLQAFCIWLSLLANVLGKSVLWRSYVVSYRLITYRSIYMYTDWSYTDHTSIDQISIGSSIYIDWSCIYWSDIDWLDEAYMDGPQ